MSPIELKDKILAFLNQDTDIRNAIIYFTDYNIYIHEINNTKLDIDALFFQSYANKKISEHEASKFVEANYKLTNCLDLLLKITPIQTKFRRENYCCNEMITILLENEEMRPLVYNRMEE